MAIEEAMLGDTPTQPPPSDVSAGDGVDALFDPRLTRGGRGLTPACRDLMCGLLQDDPNRRLGSGCGSRDSKARWLEVKQHAWFASVNWTAAAAKQLKPPFKPDISVANCDPVFELEEQIIHSQIKLPTLTPQQQQKFKGWEFATKIDLAVEDTELEAAALTRRTEAGPNMYEVSRA